MTTEDLSGSLDRYGSLQVLVKARQHKADELQAQIPRLESQVQALTEQRDNFGGAVQAVREKALREVTNAGRQEGPGNCRGRGGGAAGRGKT